jgi:hypothetical protein
MSTKLILVNTTGSQTVDRILCQLVARFEEQFPQRVRGYYLLGSYADQSAAGPLSDIDLFILFKAHFINPEEQETARSLIERCARESPIRLDANATCEGELSQLHAVIQVAIKAGSLLVYGEDSRPTMPLPPIEKYAQDVAGGALFFIGKVLRNTETIVLPVTYPDPKGEFYGYVQKRIDSWYPVTVPAGTKELVACMSRIATAMIALQAKVYVTGKAESIRLYRLHIGDQWADFLETLYNQAKQQWRYLVPEDQAARASLRQLCTQALAFENHFLGLYRTDLLDLASSGTEEEKQLASERLQHLM